MDLAVPEGHRIKLKESEKRDKYLDLARELFKKRNIMVTVITIAIGAFGKIFKDYSIIKIGQNTEKSPGGLTKLAVT